MTLHTPKLDEIVDLDALGAIYVFKNGIDRSDVEPWGGGPFGFQIDEKLEGEMLKQRERLRLRDIEERLSRRIILQSR